MECLVSGVRLLLPLGWKEEVLKIFRIAFPIIVSLMTLVVAPNISLIFCGQIGKTELDAVSLAITIINTFAINTWQGLGFACDTFFSQAYGSGYRHQMGEILQRCLLIMLLPCFVVVAIFVNAEHLLLVLGQEEEISRMAGEFILIFSAALPALAVTIVLMKFQQTQSIVIPSMVIGSAATVVSVGLHALLVNVLNMGTTGGAIALTLSYWCQAVCHLAYFKLSGLYLRTWSGWTINCLRGWGAFLSLAIPSLLMTSSEWLYMEALTIMSGILGDIQLGAYSIAYQVLNIVFMMPVGFSVAVSVRIGNSLGAQNTNAAIFTKDIALRIAAILGSCSGLLLLALKDYIPRAFTSDPEIIELASTLLMLVALFEVFEAFQVISLGILRGCAQQKKGAIVCCFAFFVVGWPVSASLMFASTLEVLGSLTGVTIAVIIQFVIFMILISRINWDSTARQAQSRVNSNIEYQKRRSITEKNNGTRASNAVYKPNGYIHDSERQPILSQDSNQHPFEISEHTLYNSLSVPIVEIKTGKLLVSQLVCRRVLALILFIVFLACGVTLREVLYNMSYPTPVNATVICNYSLSNMSSYVGK